MNSKTNALQEMDHLPVHSAVIKNVIPSVITGLMVLIYNMADKIFIAMTGNDLMVSAVTIATPVFMLFLAFGQIFGVGGVALISRLTGEGDHKRIDQASSFCCWGSIGTGIILMGILLIFMSPIIKILGAGQAETVQYTRDYLTYIAICTPFAILSSALSSMVRANGKPTLSMIGMIAGNLLNVILDPIFILVMNGGTKGAAIATLLGQLVSALFYLICIYQGKRRSIFVFVILP